MKIKWLGQSTFVIKSNTTLVTDPHDPPLGELPKDLSASIVTVSHNHHDHNYVEGVMGKPIIVSQLGNASINEFRIKGISTYHDSCLGSKRGENIVYTIGVEDINICHLGDLGHILDDKQLNDIGHVDILMIPVGGYYTIDGNEAVQVVKQINPRIVIPMHYKQASDKDSSLPISTVDGFLNALRWNIKQVSEFEIDRSGLDSIDHQVVVFTL